MSRPNGSCVYCDWSPGSELLPVHIREGRKVSCRYGSVRANMAIGLGDLRSVTTRYSYAAVRELTSKTILCYVHRPLYASRTTLLVARSASTLDEGNIRMWIVRHGKVLTV